MATVPSASKVHPLREMRERQGLSLRQVAERSGVEFGYLAKIERGERRGSIRTLRKVARALGMGDRPELLLALYDPEAR